MKPLLRRLLLLLLASALIVCLAFPSALAAEPSEEPAEDPSETSVPTFSSDEELEEIILQLNQEYEPVDIGIAMYFVGTGESIYYNADHWYATASLYKLPMLMTICRSQADGSADRFLHVFNDDFEKVKHDILAFSNNTYALGLLGTFKDDDLLKRTVELSGYEPSEDDWHLLQRGKYSPRFYLGILKELYYNSDWYPNVIDYMCEAQPEKYLRHYMEDQYRIAQKYGSVEFDNHIGGIVFSDPPVLIVIMTSGCNSSGGEGRIGVIGQRLMEYAETVNQRYSDYLVQPDAQPLPRPTAQPLPRPTEQPAPEATEQPAPEATEQPAPEATEQPVPEATEQPAAEKTWKLPLLPDGKDLDSSVLVKYLIKGSILLGLAVLCIIQLVRSRDD